MTVRIYKGGERIGNEATILLEGAGRQITLPKALRMKLRMAGWRNGPVYLFFDEKLNELRVIPVAVAYKMIEQGLRNGLMDQYVTPEIRQAAEKEAQAEATRSGGGSRSIRKLKNADARI